MKKYILPLLLFLVLSCDKRPRNEHYFIYFTNTSSDVIYVGNWYWIWGDKPDYLDSIYHPCNPPEEKLAVAPNTTNNSALALRYWLTYEYMFKHTDTFTVYVFTDYFSASQHQDLSLDDLILLRNELTLACYKLSLNDLVTLDYQLSYPPDERMRNITMEPPYESYKQPHYVD